MKSLTIRGLDEMLEKALHQKSKEIHQSLNKTILGILREALGIGTERYRTYHDLDNLAGTWSDEEFEDFQKNTEVFEQIDRELWK